MPELIDRKYLLAYLAEIKPDEYVSAFGEAAVQVIGLIEEFVKEMPTIEAEPIVRCGECRYMEPNGHCTQFADDHIRPSVSDFCSAGARMDGGADNG